MNLRRRVPVGISRELIAHHADQHPCPPAEPDHRVCPCGSTIAICCGVCGATVFAAAPRGSVMCEHLAELLEEVPA